MGCPRYFRDACFVSGPGACARTTRTARGTGRWETPTDAHVKPLGCPAGRDGACLGCWTGRRYLYTKRCRGDVKVTRQRVRAWQPDFLAALSSTGNVRLSAQEAGVSRKTCYEARNRSSKFRDQWDTALEEAADILEAEARRRAVEGWDEPVYQKGELVGVVRKFSDQLLITLMRADRPARFARRTVEITDEALEAELAQARERVARLRVITGGKEA